ncbi:DENN domain-containing protein 1A [Trichonephila inaurata madagascariensis]|uniref:DENN domain-containing protein 1A n=1 Tax=Trichonephila inaurata madagascariensis TaxID=2747483 RepID=A0A8X7CM29_9ARAC|nr:DENN domain-containing protein 1A [Trichonephila inaurata madagascariensis]
MGTRIKKNPNLLFEVICEIGIPPESTKEPWITWKFPHNYKRAEILKCLPSFAYPCEFLKKICVSACLGRREALCLVITLPPELNSFRGHT